MVRASTFLLGQTVKKTHIFKCYLLFKLLCFKNWFSLIKKTTDLDVKISSASPEDPCQPSAGLVFHITSHHSHQLMNNAWRFSPWSLLDWFLMGFFSGTQKDVRSVWVKTGNRVFMWRYLSVFSGSFVGWCWKTYKFFRFKLNTL